MTFAAPNTGDGTETYDWLFDDAGSSPEVSLSDISGKISGSDTSALVITDAQAADEGNYRVQINDGCVVSSIAQLVCKS